MIKLSISITIISMLVWGCSNSSPEKSIEKTKVAIAEDHQQSEEEAIVLDNGKKWEVDANMMVHIQNMKKDIFSFEAKCFSDYSVLAKKLESNVELLTSNCTMEGQAHDELHKWLLPYIDLVNKFSKSKSEQESIEYFEKIKLSFVTFNTYFE